MRDASLGYAVVVLSPRPGYPGGQLNEHRLADPIPRGRPNA